jgi:hypothetical protein
VGPSLIPVTGPRKLVCGHLVYLLRRLKNPIRRAENLQGSQSLESFASIFLRWASSVGGE